MYRVIQAGSELVQFIDECVWKGFIGLIQGTKTTGSQHGWSNNYASRAESSIFISHARSDSDGYRDELNWFIRTEARRNAQLDFVASHLLEDVLQWESGKRVKDLFNASSIFGCLTTLPPTVEFIEQDPGRQYITGSFHPDDRDFFAQAYGEITTNTTGAEPPTGM